MHGSIDFLVLEDLRTYRHGNRPNFSLVCFHVSCKEGQTSNLTKLLRIRVSYNFIARANGAAISRVIIDGDNFIALNQPRQSSPQSNCQARPCGL
jgi:hypothetical protein